MQVNDKNTIRAKRQEMLADPRAGISEWTKGSIEGQPVATGADGGQLASAVKAYFNKNKKGDKANVFSVPNSLESSSDVVKAIKDGKLSKRDSISYVEKFKLVSADKLDDLTSASAFDILVADSENEKVHAQILSEAMDSVGHEDQPTPKSESINDSSLVSKESDVNTSKHEETPKPEMKPTTADKNIKSDSTDVKNPPLPAPSKASDVNTAKPEENSPAAKKQDINDSSLKSKESDVNNAKVEANKVIADSTDLKNPKLPTPSKESDVNTAKPEEGGPSVKQMNINDSNMNSKESDVNTAKPEENSPAPTNMAKKKVKADDVTPEEVAEMSDIEKLNEAIDLINTTKDKVEDLSLILDSIDIKEPKKKKEEKEEKSEKKDDKKEDKKDEKPEKKEEKVEKEPKEDKIEDLPPMGDSGNAMPDFPPIMSYKVELMRDEKSPEDSYYAVSLKDKPLFMISARQAFKNPTDRLTHFASNEYKSLLLNALNKQGARKVFDESLGSKGVVTAQEDKLPDDKFDAPAKDMVASPDVIKDITNDDTKHGDYLDMILEVAATVISQSKGTTSDELVDELTNTFSDPEKTSKFAGMLKEKVDRKHKDHGDKDMAPGMPADMPKEDMGGMKDTLAKLREALKVNLPRLKDSYLKVVAENKEMKDKLAEIDGQNVLKARISATKELASKKAEYGLIDKGDINFEALRLAKLTDEEYSKEIKEFENSVKIASKLNKKQDYSNIEKENTRVAEKVLASVPSQINEVKDNPTIQWSRGFRGR